MRSVLIEFPGHGGGRLFNEQARDAVLDPFIQLREALQRKGLAFETADDRGLRDARSVILWDWDDAYDPPLWRRTLHRLGRRGSVRPIYADLRRAGAVERSVLITGEPPVVRHRNWDRDVHERFPIVLTWNDDIVDGRRFHKFLWPITSVAPKVADVPFTERKLLVNISANKLSSHRLELYSARRATIRHFERTRPAEFDLYGPGWDSAGAGEPAYRSWRGTITHKWDVLPRYRFALCYENMRDTKGFITEKIFDAMRAGCVPVYLGASNVADHVDLEAFVDRRRFGSDSDLDRALADMPEAEWKRFRAAARDYLTGPRFAEFLPPAFVARVLAVLGL